MSSESFYLHAKKSLGQNFLSDDAVIEKIVEHVDEFLISQHKSQARILEIGPGTGVLTKALLGDAKQKYFVTAIEKDHRAIKGLQETLVKQYNNRLIIHESNILKYEPENFDLCLGNIPYYITSDILLWLCKNKYKFSGAVFMVQDEVADRLCAEINTKEYSRLTIKMQLNFKIKKLFKVSRDSFVPKPKVHSAVVLFVPNQFMFKTQEIEQKFETFTRVLFSQRRKMLRRIFAENFKICSEECVNDFWKKVETINIFPTDRPESITPIQMLDLHEAFNGIESR